MTNLRELIERALSSITFEQGVREAKWKTPQSYAFHAVSVGTLAYEICNAIRSVSDIGRRQLEVLGQKYGLDPDALCFFGGFIHDWNKLGSVDEARELVRKLGLEKVEEFLFGIAPNAEGRLPDNLHTPLWIAIKLADMMMVSDIASVKDVFALADSPAYRTAVRLLGEYGLSLGHISTKFRLFTLVSSRELIKELGESGYFPLMSYPDGVLFLKSKASKPVLLSTVAASLNSKVFTSDQSEIEAKVAEISKCLELNAEKFYAMNSDPRSVLYKKDDKGHEKATSINNLLPSKVCKPFEDIAGNLDNASKLEVAKRVIAKYRDTMPFAPLVYFVHKFSKADDDSEHYIKDGLGIGKFPDYLSGMKPDDARKKLDEIVTLLEKRYSSADAGVDATIQHFVKTSFGGDVIDDLPAEVGKPRNYCVVCGMPIYGSSVRFAQYAYELNGKTEIWIPRERSLESIDTLRDHLRICPVCLYEANLMKNWLKPPYFIISFYPGIPVRLLDVLDFDTDLSRRVYSVGRAVRNDKSYLEVFRELGGVLTDSPKRTFSAYAGSKIVVPLSEVITTKLFTRLDKRTLNHALPYAPMLSVIFLTSPVTVGSTVYEIPLNNADGEKAKLVAVSSPFNYAFTKPLKSNISTLKVLFSYAVKYAALRKLCKGDADMKNCLAKMVSEMDLYSSIDPELGVLGLGAGVGTPLGKDSTFFSSFLPAVGFLLNTAMEVGEMEGKKDISSSILSLAFVLKEVAGEGNTSKHQVIGFFRDGVEMFFKTSSVLDSRDDRVNIAVNAALASLENKYSLNDSQRARAYSALQNIFGKLYEIERDADRSLAMSIANTITNWIYMAYMYISSSQGEKE